MIQYLRSHDDKTGVFTYRISRGLGATVIGTYRKHSDGSWLVYPVGGEGFIAVNQAGAEAHIREQHSKREAAVGVLAVVSEGCYPNER